MTNVDNITVYIPNTGVATATSTTDTITQNSTLPTISDVTRKVTYYVAQLPDKDPWTKETIESQSNSVRDEVETKTISETIHYVYADGCQAAKDVTTYVTLTRTTTYDVVTGQVISSTLWTTDAFQAVDSPEIDGYTADHATIAKYSVDNTTTNKPFRVTYTLGTENEVGSIPTNSATSNDGDNLPQLGDDETGTTVLAVLGIML